jgi:protein SCO1
MVHRLLQISTGIALGLAITAGVFLLTLRPSGMGDWSGGSPPPAPYPAPSLQLPDLEGNPFQLASLRGETAVVFFGYSNCPDVCPATLLNLTRALDQMGQQAERVRIVFVTVDPDRDTPDRLTEWLRNFHPGILALRGSEAEIAAATAAWGVHVAVHPASGEGTPAERDLAEEGTGHAHGTSGHAHPSDATSPPPGGYGVDHSARAIVVDRSGRVVLFLAPFQDGASMAADLRRIVR